MLLFLLLFLVVAAIGGGAWGHGRGWGYAGWSPLGLVLVVLVVMYLTGHLGPLRSW